MRVETPLYNLDVLKMTTDGDKEFLVKILTTFLANNRESLANIKEALIHQDMHEIGVFAHKMLSSYRHLEVNLLIDGLVKLEQMSLGFELGMKEVQEIVDYLSFYSNKLFSELEIEIGQVN